jgi:hypothetical protein
MTNHADHNHPNTPGARAACRRRAILAPTTFDIPAGRIRVGSIVRTSFNAAATDPINGTQNCTVTGWELGADKRGEDLIDLTDASGELRWAYADQPMVIIKF